MKKSFLKYILCFSVLFLGMLGIYFSSHKIYADTLSISDQAVEIISKDDIIQSYANDTGVSLKQAEKELFPSQIGTRFRSSAGEVSYVRLRSAAQYSTLNSIVPDNAGSVYFYCEVSVSGNFRGIKRIVYAGYNSGQYAFQGNFQYHLENPNKIHYTLSGALHSHTTSSGSIGTSIGVGQSASVNIGLAGSSSFVKNILYHGNRYY